MVTHQPPSLSPLVQRFREAFLVPLCLLGREVERGKQGVKKQCKLILSMKYLKYFSCLGIVLFLLSACQEQSPLSFSQEPTISANPHPSTPLTAFLHFKTSLAHDSVLISLQSNDHSFQLAYAQKEKVNNGYLLMLMKANQTYQVSVSLKVGQSHTFPFPQTFTYRTPALPIDDTLFPRIDITHSVKTGNSGELTLLNPRRRIPVSQAGGHLFNKSFGMLAIVNRKGEVLWYYHTDSRISDFDLLPNGHISYLTQDSRIVEIDLAGNVIHQWYAARRPEGPDTVSTPVDAQTFHHDVSLLPNGNRLVLSTEVREFDNYYTSETDPHAPRKRQQVVGDVVLEFTPEGEVLHTWKAFDHLPVMRIGYETFSQYWERRGFPGAIDWSHANAVVPLPDEDAYLVNFRYQSAIIKVNKSSGEIEWIFAEPTGWGKELQDKLLDIPETGWNWHQHSPRFTQNGNLLFFNNNNFQARPFDKTPSIAESPSYVAEYQIDEDTKTVKRVWTTETAQEEKVTSIAMGRVSELEETGNILACFGAVLDSKYYDEMTWWNRIRFPQWTMVREYTHTSEPEIVWEMRLKPLTEESKVSWTLFGAERIRLHPYRPGFL